MRKDREIKVSDYLAMLPSSIGLELESNREIIDALENILEPALCMDTHAESSRIVEANLKPAYTKSVTDVLLSGEIVRRANPFHWIGGEDEASGSAHCHVNQPDTDVVIKELLLYNDIGLYDCTISKTHDYNKQNYVATFYWNKGVQAGLLPFLSMGYMKRTNNYTFRAKIHNITKYEVYTRIRGTGMMCNNDVTYGNNNFGLEYRANENTPLWIYILPILALNVNRGTEFGELLKSLRPLYKNAGSIGRHDINIHSNTINTVLEKIRPYLIDNIELMSSAVVDEEKEIFKHIMHAYLSEDIDMHDAIVENVLSTAKGAKQILDSINHMVSMPIVKQYATELEDRLPEGTYIEYLNAVHSNLFKETGEISNGN